MQTNVVPKADWQTELRQFGLEPGRPLQARVEIAVRAEAVWQIIAAPGNLKQFHPFCAATAVDRWPGRGARDSITYYSGIRYQRNFVAWQDGVGYDIELGDRPHQTARVLWRVAPTSRPTCRLSLEVFPLVKAELSAAKKQAYQDRLFGEVLQHYLECVVKGVQFFATTGRPVRKDQFGKNALYSD